MSSDLDILGAMADDYRAGKADAILNIVLHLAKSDARFLDKLRALVIDLNKIDEAHVRGCNPEELGSFVWELARAHIENIGESVASRVPGKRLDARELSREICDGGVARCVVSMKQRIYCEDCDYVFISGIPGDELTRELTRLEGQNANSPCPGCKYNPVFLATGFDP